jgi:hypothetical protein
MNSPNTISVARAWLARMAGDGHHFKVFRPYYQLMKKLDVLFLHDLINLSDASKYKDDNDYFLCTRHYLELVGWSRMEQQARFKSLQKGKWVKAEQRGRERLRWVWIDFQHLMNALNTCSVSASNDVVGPTLNDVGIKGTLSEYPTKNKQCPLPDSAATPPRGDGDGAGIPMFPLEIPGQDKSRTPRRSRPKHASKTPSPQARGYAARLLDAVIKAGQQHPASSINGWAKYLDDTIIAFTASRFETVFNWYLNNIDKPGVPWAYCGESFYRKFVAIERAMKKNHKANPQVTVSPQAAKLAKRFDNWGWPKGSETQLPTVVQVSIDRIEELVTKLNGVYSVRQSPVENRLVLEVIRQTADVNWLLTEWFRDVHRRVANWAAWSGDLMPFAFDFNSKQFRAMAQDWSRKKCGDPTVWDKILKEILK